MAKTLTLDGLRPGGLNIFKEAGALTLFWVSRSTRNRRDKPR